MADSMSQSTSPPLPSEAVRQPCPPPAPGPPGEAEGEGEAEGAEASARPCLTRRAWWDLRARSRSNRSWECVPLGCEWGGSAAGHRTVTLSR